MSDQRVLPANRREQLLALVAAQGSIRVSEAAAALAVSPITIRRDIALLAQEGQLEQVRGGARRRTSPTTPLRAGTTIGIVTPSLDFFWPAIIEGATHAADELDVKLILQGSTFSARDNLTQFQTMAANLQVDGLLLVPDLEGKDSRALVSFLDTLDVPTVLIERSLRPHGRFARIFESVLTDHFNGAQLAVRHLHELGHRRVALLTDKFVPSRIVIKSGWRATLADLGMDTTSPHLETTGLAGLERSAAIAKFARRCIDDHVTAVIVHSDEAAVSMLEYLQSEGLSIPQDMSIISYDDEVAKLARPSLTAIAPPKMALGATAVRALINRLTHPDSPFQRIELQPTLVVRDSTAPPRADAHRLTRANAENFTSKA